MGASGLVESSDPRHRGKDLVDWPPGGARWICFRPIIPWSAFLPQVWIACAPADYLGETDDSCFLAAYRGRLAMFFELLTWIASRFATNWHGPCCNMPTSSLAFGYPPRIGRSCCRASEPGMRCSVYAAHYLLRRCLEPGRCSGDGVDSGRYRSQLEHS